MNLSQYDAIVPLGEECYTCSSIDTKFNSGTTLRKYALPFDYVGHVFIESIYTKLTELADPSLSTSLDPSHISIQLFGDTYFYVDSIHKFNYWHDTSYKNIDQFTSTDLSTFVDKYRRRYDRLVDCIKTQKKVCFISVNHYDNIYKNTYKKQELIKLYEILYSLNKNCTLLAFNYDSDSFQHEQLQHVVLPFSKELPFQESKIQFQNQLNAFVKNNI